jgi:diacylglycerol kinase family enzyme
MAESGDTSNAQNRGERLIVIANPRAGGGRAGADRERIEAAVRRAFARSEVRWTEAPGHAATLARAAAEEADIVAALGGDGTCSEVVNGLVPGGIPVNPKVVFAVIPFGTGGDLVRSLEVPKVLEKALWVASTGTTLPLDLGLIRWDDGRTRTFVNVAGVGANGEVCRRANGSSKRFGGTATFLGAVIGTIVSYRPVASRWSWDGPDGHGEYEGDTMAAFCANGHYCGAGMWVGKGGSMADGLFDLTILGGVGVGQAFRLLPRLYDGRLAEVSIARRVRAHTVRADAVLPMEGDGETIPPAPATLTVLPRALQIRGGWLRPPGAS